MLFPKVSTLSPLHLPYLAQAPYLPGIYHSGICGETIDKIGAREKLEREIARQKQFMNGVLGQEFENGANVDQVNLRNYAKYLLKEGAREEKRELLCHLKNRILIKGGKIELK